MTADAKRWGWHWVVASVDETGEVRILDPSKARRGREIRLGGDATIDNLLAWIDAKPP